MNRSRRLAVMFLVPSLALALASGAGGVGNAPNRCCFTNERFAGVCEVMPEQGTTCADILAYLNNPSAAGKTYCGSTDIRGGWVQVECPEEAPPPSREASSGSEVATAAGRDARHPSHGSR